MINISAELKDAIESFGYNKSLSIRLNDLDISSDLISQDSVSLVQGLSSRDNYSIGNTLCSELNFSIINNKNRYTDISFYNNIINVTANIQTQLGVTRTVSFGSFICQRPTITNTGKIDIRAYDYMIKLETSGDRFLDSLDYPISLLDFMRAACEYVGIAHNIADDIVNANFQIKKRPSSTKLTIRSLMNKALELAGGNAQINLNTNEFEVVYLTDTEYEIPTKVHFDSVKIQDYQIALISCIVASNGENADIKYGDETGYVYYIDNNDLIYDCTDEEIYNALGNILPKLSNINYKPFELNIKRGLMFLQPCDIVSFEYDNITYKVPILERTLTGIYLEDSLSASGSEDRDKLRDDNVTGGQIASTFNSYISGNRPSAFKTYYTDENYSKLSEIGAILSDGSTEIVFKPLYQNGLLAGFKTNFDINFPNTNIPHPYDWGEDDVEQ